MECGQSVCKGGMGSEGVESGRLLVVESGKVWDRMMAAKLIFEGNVLRLITGCALQNGRGLKEKPSFYDEIKCKLDMYSVVECLGDFDQHLDRHIDRFDCVHGGCGIDQRNLKEECN